MCSVPLKILDKNQVPNYTDVSKASMGTGVNIFYTKDYTLATSGKFSTLKFF